MNLAALLLSFALLIVAMTFHEFAHGMVAYKLGDNTAKFSGRLTLNPLAHIDPVWTVLIPFVLYLSTNGQFVFGAAKPVPIDYWQLKNPKRDIVWIGLSGPLANFILAFIVSLVIRFMPLPPFFTLIGIQFIVINVVLGVFNLMPLPPLDGSRVLMGFLPDEWAAKLALIESYSFIILILFLWSGAFERVIWPVVGIILRLMGVAH